MPDLPHHVSVVTILPLAVQSATVTSANFDLVEFDAFSILVTTGEIVGAGDFRATLQHADTASSTNFIDVSAIDLIGALPPSLAANAVVKLGYKGDKRYLRVVITKNGGTSIEAGIGSRGPPAAALLNRCPGAGLPVDASPKETTSPGLVQPAGW